MDTKKQTSLTEEVKTFKWIDTVNYILARIVELSQRPFFSEMDYIATVKKRLFYESEIIRMAEMADRYNTLVQRMTKEEIGKILEREPIKQKP